MEEYVCSICGNKFTGWGNNPWPVTQGENDRCCDDCNFIVTQERMSLMFGGNNDRSN